MSGEGCPDGAKRSHTLGRIQSGEPSCVGVAALPSKNLLPMKATGLQFVCVTISSAAQLLAAAKDRVLHSRYLRRRSIRARLPCDGYHAIGKTINPLG